MKSAWRFRSVRAAVWVGLAMGLEAVGASASDWPRWRGPDLNGISSESGWWVGWPAEGPRKLWQASVGTGFSSVAVAGGRVFTLGNTNGEETVFCLEAATGKELWRDTYACPLDPKYYEGGPGATPTVVGERVFTLSKRGHLHAYEAGTGRVIWRKDLMAELGVKKPEWGFAGSPLAVGDGLILNVGGAGTAVEQATGRVRWTSDTNLAGYATPVPLGGGGSGGWVAIFSGEALVGVRAEDGRVGWRHPWVERWKINAADPIRVGDRLFVSTFDRGAALIDPTAAGGPRVIWENKLMGNHFNSCLLIDGHLYGVHGNTDVAHKDLRCLEASSGKLKWTFEGLGLGSVTAAGGRLIVLSERGELVVGPASPEGFRPEARAQVLGGKCWTVPVLAKGRLYCRNAQGTLVCLELRAG